MHHFSVHFEKNPQLKLNVAFGKEYIDFQAMDSFSILDIENKPIIENINPEKKWRVKTLKFDPPQYHYNIKMNRRFTRKQAERIISKISFSDIQPEIRQIGGEISIDDHVISDTSQYEILLDSFNTIDEAKFFQQNHQSDYSLVLEPEKIRDQRGKIEICDAEYSQSAQIENGLKIIFKKSKAKTRLFANAISRRHYRNMPTQSSYLGNMEFILNENGGIDAVQSILFEVYLKGVLSAFGDSETPKEVSKAFSVIARSKLLADYGIGHLHDHYDICFKSHCQPFCGYADFPDYASKSVETTKGEVLFLSNQILPLETTCNCGGYTEKKLFYARVHDFESNKSKSLKSDKTVLEWIKSRPESYCNFASQNEDRNYSSFSRNFRWEVTWSKSELEKIITDNTGVSIGQLYDIIISERSSSGRILSLEILGSRKNLTLQHFENICHILSDHPLPSHAFLIQKTMGDDGIPIEYTFLGAGEGHGMGFCRAGAIGMALQNKNYKEILMHYFPNSIIKKLY